jgi:uroporphyrinogen-III synthase
VRLLVTRPEPDAQHTAAALRACGHETIVASLLSIEVAFDADLGPGPWSAVLITSANAVHAVSGHARFGELQAAPVFAVGRRSADAARTAGFADVTSADGGVTDLARLVRARVAASARVLYLAGEERSGDLAGDLAEFETRTVAIYRAVGAVALPPTAHEALMAGRLTLTPRVPPACSPPRSRPRIIAFRHKSPNRSRRRARRTSASPCGLPKRR